MSWTAAAVDVVFFRKTFRPGPFVVADWFVAGLYMSLLAPGVEVGDGPDGVHVDDFTMDQMFQDHFPLVWMC
jgi:hypothetical protein